jgi:HNH endonuclease
MSPIFKNGVAIHTKGYPRCTAGPMRGILIHRAIASAMIGRDLTKDEEVHHKDGDRLNFHWRNLIIMGEKDHSWVSNKQAWFMREKDRKEKIEWDAFMAEKAAEFDGEVAEARKLGGTWQATRKDGDMEKQWEETRHSMIP